MVIARLACCPPTSAASLRYSSLTRKAGTVVGEVATLSTGAPVTARRGGTGHQGALTQWPCVASWALAAEGARCVETGATMAAGSAHPALIHVASAAAALVARWAGADVAAIGPHRAAGTMGTGAAEAGVWQGAVWAWTEPERVSLGLTTPLPAPGSLPDPPLPRKPRGQRQENRAVPATTELWQTPWPAHGPEWQGSSS